MTAEDDPIFPGSERNVTAQGEEAEALRRERDLLSAVLDTAGTLVVVLDRQGRIVRFNHACERTTGYSCEEAKGHAVWDLLLAPEEVQPVRAVFEQLRAGQFPNEYENYWLTKDGRRRLIAWSNTALLGADGAVEYAIGAGIDVTERRQAEAQRDATLEALRQARDELERRVAERTAELERANQILEEEVIERRQVEEALRESESHLRSLMESAQHYAVYRIALDPTHPYLARVVLASPSLKELVGTADLYDLATWFTNVHPDDLARCEEANRLSLETGVPFDEQFRVLRPERGEWHWVHDRSMPAFDAAGTLTHFNGLMVDITEQKHVEEQLRRQNEYLAALHDTTLGVVSRLDISELLETAMERAVNLVGAAYGFVYLVRSEEAEIEVVIGTGPYREYLGRRLKRGEGLAGKVYESGQPLAVEDYQTWPGRSLQFEGTAFGPALGAPLMSGEVVVGVLGVGRAPSALPFRQDEIDLIHRFSHLAAIALDNARLYSSTQQHLSELQQAQQVLQHRLASEGLVARISTEFVNLGPAEIDTGIEHALQAIGQVAGVDRSYVFQFSGDRTILDNTHEWCAEGIQPHMDSLRGLPRAAFPWFVQRLEQLEVVSVPRVAELPPEADLERAECEREGIQSIILVPLTYQVALVGFLGFDSVAKERSWGEESIALLKTVAGIIVNALEHKRAQAVQAGQRQFLELLATGGDFSETLQTLVRLIEDQWPGMLGLILLLDEDGKHLHIGASVSLPQDYVQSIEGLEIGPMVGSCGTACYRRERVIVEDTATDPRWEGLRDLALQYGLRACWSEPVFSPDGQVVGTFAMYYRRPRAPTEAELRAIEMGGHLVGVAIEHRRAELALRESEEKFRGIVELANVGIAIVLDARFRFVNQHWASMLGYTVEELLGREFMPYCTPEERDRIVGYYTRRVRGEPAPTRYETVMLHKDGTRVYAEVSVGMIPYEGRQATFVFLRDITEQRRVEDALRQSELRFRAVFEGAPIGISVTSLKGQLLETNRALQQMFGYTGEEFYNLPVEAFTQPDDMAVDANLFYDELVPGKRDGYQMEKRFFRKNGEMFWGRLSLSLARGDRGGPLFAIATTEDITERKQAQDALQEAYQTLEQRVDERTRQLTTLLAENASLYRAEQSRREEAERRRRVADGLRDILAILNSNRPLGEILDYIVTHASRILGSDATVLCRLDRQTQWLTIQASHGLSAEFVEHMAFQVGRVSIIGEAVLTRRPTTTSNLADRLAHPDIPAEAREMAARFAAIYRTILAVPLLQKEEIYGALAMYFRAERQFTEEEINVAVTFADQAALAIENARLREQAEQAAAMQERGRLARELHDSVTQSLYSVTMYTEAAARLMMAGQAAEAAEHLRDARDTAQEALREMRLMIYQLRPPVLEKGGLAVALQVRLDAVERRGGMRAELIAEGEDRLPPAVQAELHQIAQEALNNALKHAHARQVRVHLHFGDDVTVLRVQDDGVGFDPTAVRPGGGLGVPGMRERAQKIGARLDIVSAPGGGTQVIVEVPTGGGG